MHRWISVLAAGFIAAVAVSPVVASDGPPSRHTATTVTSQPSEPPSSSTSATSPYGDGTASPGPSSSSSTSSTSATSSGSPSNPPPSGSTSPTTVCEPVAEHLPAPAEGSSEVYDAGEAGTVEVARISADDLQIGEVMPNPGWVHEVTGASGPRVKVRFDNDTASPSRIRFAATMDDAGREIHIRVTSCG